MDKLSEIMHTTREELAPRLRPVSPAELARYNTRSRPNFKQALSQKGQLNVLAEIKRKSPSAGNIAEGASAAEQARTYYNAGAAALSVLTNAPYFGGSLQDLWDVSDFMQARSNPLPLLRKDFFFHPLQVLEAAEAGASAVLIIVRALEDAEINALFKAANTAGLCSLFEVHSKADITRALAAGAEIIGVNNRDLSTFTTNLNLTQTLLPFINTAADEKASGRSILKISESGIHTPENAATVRAAGAQAVLVGEALMRADNTEALIDAFHAA